MGELTIIDVPESIIKKLWNKASFNDIQWLYWDWMDWCQYDEVLPTSEDIKNYKLFKNEIFDKNKDWKTFLKNLISK